jgi:sugar/nucleoside kinase (ribokinase family)
LAPIGENTEDLENDLVAKHSEENSLIAWNPGATQIKKSASHYRSLLRNISVLFLNREEALKFLNLPVKPAPDLVLQKLHLFGPKLVVVTNGKEGARAYDGTRFYQINSLGSAGMVDATGAGDSFATAVMAKLLSCGWSGESDQSCISEALKWGIANSSSVIRYVGGQKGLLSKAEIEKITKDNQRLKVEIY